MTPRLAVLVLFVAGCSAQLFADRAEPRPPPRACAVDTDCSRERREICRLPNGSGTPTLVPDGGQQSFDGVCVIPSGAGAGEVFLEVRPLATDVPVAQIGPIRLADGQNQPIVVPAAVPVLGMVAYHGTQPSQPVKRAKLKFKLSSVIPDRPVMFETTTGGDEDDYPGHFAGLFPTGRYNLVVVPPALPNLDLKAPAERPLADGFDIMDLAGKVNVFELSNPNELVTFTGRALLRQDGKDVPATNVQVWAMSAKSISRGETGPRALTGRPLAQPVTTDADGKFTLWLPRLAPDDDGHHVRLQFGPGPDGAPFPTFVDPTEYTVGPSGAKPLDAPVAGHVDSPVVVRGRVVALNRFGVLQGVPQARVTFRTGDDARFSYTLTVLADAKGNYEAKLFPEVYTALALPPPDSDLAAGLCPLETGPGFFEVEPGADTTRGFLCEERFPLFGEVRNGSATVPDVVVEAVRRKDALVAEEIRVRATTDETGAFALDLPRGTWDIALTAPAELKMPVKLLRGIEMPPAKDLAGESIVVEMDPPFELFGQLFSGSERHPLAATIEAYALGADGASLLVGQSVAKDDGSYSLVLPAAP